MTTIAVLRPKPGNAATAARLEALGHHVLRLPLFEVVPVAWDVPDPAMFDGLLVTSANAVRHAGAGLERLKTLPVHAVGTATARAAERAGFAVATVGDSNAAALLQQVQARALLHLAGRDHARTGLPVAATTVVYASEPAPLPPGALDLLAGGIALVHSPRAGRRLAELLDAAAISRSEVALAVISAAAREAAGPGWARIAVSPRPDDATLVATARLLAD